MECLTNESQILFEDSSALVTYALVPFHVEQLEEWKGWFDDFERERHRLYRRKIDQDLFVARRGLARVNLAKVTGLSPDSIQFHESLSGKLTWHVREESRYSQNRKPTNSGVHPTVDFSVSRTSTMVLAAVSKKFSIGVDVETIQDLPELNLLTRQNLHPDELEVWKTLSADQQLESYYHLWVVKEAFVKALGLGLSIPPEWVLAIEALEQRSSGKVAVCLAGENPLVGRFRISKISANQIYALVTSSHADRDTQKA